MNRTYSQGWDDIFGKDLPKKPTLEQASKPAKKPKDSEPAAVINATTVNSADIDWKNTRALSIRQPWAELIMQERKEEEYRSGPTRIRGRIAIYASLGRYEKYEEEDLEAEYALSIDELPRGVLVGTVELHDCIYDEQNGDYAWLLRDPKRLATPIKPTKHPQPIWFYPFGRE